MLQLGPREHAVSRLPSGELERVTPGIATARAGKRTRFRLESVTPNKSLTIRALGLPEVGELKIKVRPGEELFVVFPPKL